MYISGLNMIYHAYEYHYCNCIVLSYEELSECIHVFIPPLNIE